jgi:lactoylglutathione lyase
VAYRVTDLDHSLAFYTALGYIELGRVQVADAARIAILPEHPDGITAADFS